MMVSNDEILTSVNFRLSNVANCSISIIKRSTIHARYLISTCSHGHNVLARKDLGNGLVS